MSPRRYTEHPHYSYTVLGVVVYLSRATVRFRFCLPADKYEILASSHSTAIGDETIELKLKISDKDYQTIKQIIESLENFQVINDTVSPNRSYQGPNREREMFGWKRDETYSYEIKKTTTKGFEFYNLSLLPENIITFQYLSE